MALRRAQSHNGAFRCTERKNIEGARIKREEEKMTGEQQVKAGSIEWGRGCCVSKKAKKQNRYIDMSHASASVSASWVHALQLQV